MERLVLTKAARGAFFFKVHRVVIRVLNREGVIRATARSAHVGGTVVVLTLG